MSVYNFVRSILRQFLIPLSKNCKGAPVPGGGCASKTWSFSSACKNLVAQHPSGAEIWSSEKCALGGYNHRLRGSAALL